MKDICDKPYCWCLSLCILYISNDRWKYVFMNLLGKIDDLFACDIDQNRS